MNKCLHPNPNKMYQTWWSLFLDQLRPKALPGLTQAPTRADMNVGLAGVVDSAKES